MRRLTAADPAHLDVLLRSPVVYGALFGGSEERVACGEELECT
jgi:hypothetical protein